MISKKRSFKVLRLLICLAVIITASSMFLTIEPMASENSDELVPALEQEAALDVIPLRTQVLHTSAVAEHADSQPNILSGSVTDRQIDAALTELSKLEAEKVAQEEAETNEEALVAEIHEADVEVYTEPAEEETITSDVPDYEEPAPEAPAAPSQPSTTQRPSTSTSADTNGYSDLDYLAAICQIEAGYNYDGCLAVANVIINRLNAGYASTIYDVIYQPYQFATGQMKYYLTNGTSSTAREAAAAALAGSNNVGGYLNFNGTTWLNPETLGCPYVVIGGNCFY